MLIAHQRAFSSFFKKLKKNFFLFFGCVRSQLWYVGDLHCSMQALSLRRASFSLVVVCGFSLQLWHVGSRARGLCSCGAQAQLPGGMWGLSSLTRDQTRVPCIGRRILYHWTTAEVPFFFFLNRILRLFRVPLHSALKNLISQVPLQNFFLDKKAQILLACTLVTFSSASLMEYVPVLQWNSSHGIMKLRATCKGCLHQEGRSSWHPWGLPWNVPPALESKLLIM